MPKAIQKLLLSFLTFLVLFNASLSPLLATRAYASDWYAPDYRDFYIKVYGDPPQEIFGERYTAAQVHWILLSLVTLPLTILPFDVAKCAITGDFGACLNELIKGLGNAGKQGAIPPSQPISFRQFMLADRPISAISYFQGIGRRFHIIPEAQAQDQTRAGFGFNALEPVRQMWQAVRNFTYSLLVLVTVALALMIMFRVKLSPQVAISVQSALPKLVLTIILITFSYAIAGLLVDLMYVVIGIISIMATGFINWQGVVGPDVIFNFLVYGPADILSGEHLGIFGMIGMYMVIFTITSLAIFLAQGGALGILLTAGALILVNAIGAATGIGSVFFALAVGIILLLIVIALIIMIVKIVWMLIKALAMILLLTIFSPLYILAGALTPAIGFGTWFKSFIANLAVFPLTGLLFFLADFFLLQALRFTLSGEFADGIMASISRIVLGAAITNTGIGSGAAWPPLLGWGSQSASGLVFLGTSMVLLFTIPKAAELMQSLISGRPFAFGAAVGEALGPITGSVGFLAGGIKKGAQDYIGGEARTKAGEIRTGITTRLRYGPARPTTEGGGGGTSKPSAERNRSERELP